MHHYNPTTYNLIIFGKTGVGKTTFVNRTCRITDNDPYALKTARGGTGETSKIQYHTIHQFGVTFHVIDTPGMMDGQERDPQFLKDLETFLQTKAQHLNGFILLLNFREPRFDINTINLLKLVHKMFKDSPDFWHIFRIVFTHTFFPPYEDVKKREELMEVRRNDALTWLRNLTNDPTFTPFINFIDTADPSPQTGHTLDNILIWCKSNHPLPSKYFKPPPPKQIATETKRERKGEKEVTYQRAVLQDYQGKRSFGDWKKVSSRIHPDVLEERETNAKREAMEAKRATTRGDAKDKRENKQNVLWGNLMALGTQILKAYSENTSGNSLFLAIISFSHSKVGGRERGQRGPLDSGMRGNSGFERERTGRGNGRLRQRPSERNSGFERGRIGGDRNNQRPF